MINEAAESKRFGSFFFVTDVPVTLLLTYRLPYMLRTGNPSSYVPVTLLLTYR